MKYSQFNRIVPIPDSNSVLLYNFATEALVKLDPIQHKLFEFAMQLPENNGLVKAWKKNGFLTDVDEIEVIRAAELRRLNEYEKMTDKVLRLVLYVTSLCNFACPYCFEKNRIGNMSAQVQDAVVRYTELKLSSGGYERMTVGWFGGEPLLAADIMRNIGHRLMDTAEKYGAGFSSNIQTNAYLLDQDMIDLLEELNCRFALITLDGYGSAHDATRHLIDGGGTFDRIIENLSSIRTKIPLNIRSNLDAESVGSYDRLRSTINDIAEKTGNKMLCSPTCIHDSEASLERGYRANQMDFRSYAKTVLSTDLIERSRPYALKSSNCAVVQPDNYIIDDRGFIYAHCNELAIDPKRAYCNILDLDEENFDLPDKKHMEFAKQYVLPLESEKCMKCQLLPVCMGGCMLDRLAKRIGCNFAYRDPNRFVLELYHKLI